MSDARRNGGVMFHNDPLEAVLPYLKQVEGNALSLPDKNTVYGKVATHVNVRGDMPGTVALLIVYARAGFLVQDIRNLLVNNVAEQMNEVRLQQGKAPVSTERLARLALRRVDAKRSLVYNNGKSTFEIKPGDRAALLKAFPQIKNALPVERVRG